MSTQLPNINALQPAVPTLGSLGGLVKDVPSDQILCLILGHEFLPFIGEVPGFVLPSTYGSAIGPGKSGLQTIPTNERMAEDCTNNHKKLGVGDDDRSSVEEPGPHPVVPSGINDGYVLVTWWTSGDPENPWNWAR